MMILGIIHIWHPCRRIRRPHCPIRNGKGLLTLYSKFRPPAGASRYRNRHYNYALVCWAPFRIHLLATITEFPTTSSCFKRFSICNYWLVNFFMASTISSTISGAFSSWIGTHSEAATFRAIAIGRHYSTNTAFFNILIQFYQFCVHSHQVLLYSGSALFMNVQRQIAIRSFPAFFK